MKTAFLSLLIFANAFLIFVIQPIFAKDLLPLFGGSASVWNISCFFFQAMLLGGYIYAHKIYGHLKIHVTLLGIALLFLPFNLRIVDTGQPTLSVIAILGASCGFIYFLLSSTAPLVQKLSGLVKPYVLYSASNMGALAALVSYPVLIEPFLSRSLQKQILSVAAGLIIISLIVFVLGKRATDNPTKKIVQTPWRQSLYWIWLAFIPSSLMLGLTEYISHEMFVTPLFWIIPLGLYFLSFVLAFRNKAKNIPMIPILIAIPVLFLTMLAVDDKGAEGWKGLALMSIHLATLFYVSLALHTKLAKDAPPAENLTWFYVCLSIGGAAGGLFNSVIAPIIFNSYLEYPIVLVAAMMMTNAKKLLLIIIALICLAMQYLRNEAFTYGDSVQRYRNFYGVFTTIKNDDYTALMTTKIAMHGIQFKAFPESPAVYYYKNSPSDLFMRRYKEKLRGKNIALVGLGGGALLCYAISGQRWDVFEINPYIFELAGKNGSAFSYFDLCTPNAGEFVGDGRLEIAKQPDKKYSLIIVDVFHGFSVPAHLLTREAFEIYLSKLAQDGILLLHMNTLGMDLMPVVTAHVNNQGAYAKFKSVNSEVKSGMVQVWLAVSKSPITSLDDWDDMPSGTTVDWTDDFAPIFPVMIF